MKPQAFIFDIDGTIADCSHRLPLIYENVEKRIKKPNPDWDAFHKASNGDLPISNVMRVLASLDNAYNILFVTGRPEFTRDRTQKWLDTFLWLDSYWLYMRPDNNRRPDYQVKREIYETQIKDKYDVIGVFEDRDQCVQMWRELGLQCYQVNNGHY